MSERDSGFHLGSPASADGTPHPGEAYVCDHWHDDYVTEKHLGDLLSKWALKWIMSAIASAVLVVVWAVSLSGRVNAVEKSENGIAARLEEVRQEGTIPIQQIRLDLRDVSAKMANLTAQLEQTQRALEGRPE